MTFTFPWTQGCEKHILYYNIGMAQVPDTISHSLRAQRRLAGKYHNRLFFKTSSSNLAQDQCKGFQLLMDSMPGSKFHLLLFTLVLWLFVFFSFFSEIDNEIYSNQQKKKKKKILLHNCYTYKVYIN